MIMKENLSLDNISEVLSIDHDRIQSILNETGSVDAPKNVLQVLSSVTTYFREVITRYKYIGQTINSEQNLLKLREQYLRKDVENLQRDQANIQAYEDQLQEKIERIKNAQYVLFSRALDASEVVGNLEDEAITRIYKNLCQTLSDMQKKVDELTNKLDKVKDRQKMIENSVKLNQTYSKKSQVVLNNEQLDVIKCNCEYLNENIDMLVDNVVYLKKELDELSGKPD